MIFRYPGGKSKKSIREKILCKFPTHYLEYREPMVGGGGIFFAIPKNKNRWINDLDNNLISVYTALQTRPDEFIRSCRDIRGPIDGEELDSAKSGGKSLYSLRMKRVFDNFCDLNFKVDSALRYFFIHRTVWAGRVNYELKSRLYFSNPSGWNVVFTEKMERSSEILMNVKITNTNYTDLLLKGGNDVLIYLDPPYYKNTELNNNSRLYRMNFEKHDHDELIENIKMCKHNVILSYDNHPYIYNLYKKNNFNIYEASWTYSGTSSVTSNGQPYNKKIGKEIIITNY